MGHVTVRKRVVRWSFDSGAAPAIATAPATGTAPAATPAPGPIHTEDSVAVEEPLEIRVGGRSLTVTMRTPGNDVELAHGFLLAEGIISGREDVAAMRYCAGAVEDDETGFAKNTYNVLDVALAPGIAPPEATRNFLAASSCGLCGKASIDSVRVRSCHHLSSDHSTIDRALLASLPGRLRAQQKVFASTGGLHASGLVDLGSGELSLVREDVGRHNSVDKTIGAAVMAGRVPLRATALLVSSRASFELTQKAWMAGIPILAAVSAPSSLAIEMAAEAGMTLIGFLRDDSMVIYAGAERVVDAGAEGRRDGHQGAEPLREMGAV